MLAGPLAALSGTYQLQVRPLAWLLWLMLRRVLDTLLGAQTATFRLSDVGGCSMLKLVLLSLLLAARCGPCWAAEQHRQCNPC